jgi:hypothetical protein
VGNINLQALSGQVRAQGVSVDTPPMAWFGLGATTAVATGTATNVYSATTPSKVTQHNGADSVIYSATGGGRYIPQVSGFYRITAIVGWTAGTYEPSIGVTVNGGTTFDIGGGSVNRLDPRICATGGFEFNGSTDYFTLTVFHGAGASRDARVRQLIIERISG